MNPNQITHALIGRPPPRPARPGPARRGRRKRRDHSARGPVQRRSSTDARTSASSSRVAIRRKSRAAARSSEGSRPACRRRAPSPSKSSGRRGWRRCAVAGEHRRGRLGAPARSREAVGAVADQRQLVGDRRRAARRTSPRRRLASITSPCAGRAARPCRPRTGRGPCRACRCRPARPGRRPADLGRGAEGVVGLELDHRPDARSRPRSSASSSRGNCCEQLRVDSPAVVL